MNQSSLHKKRKFWQIFNLSNIHKTRGKEDIEAEIYAWLQELVESTTLI